MSDAKKVAEDLAQVLAEALAADIPSLVKYIHQTAAIEASLDIANKMLHAAQGDLAVYQHRLAQMEEDAGDKPRIQLLS